MSADGFQTQVNQYPAYAVEGDFASANPYATVDAGANALVAGVGGVTVGRFAWVDPADLATVYSHGAYPRAPDGFVHRDQQALITQYLGEASMNIPVGFGVTLMNQGDFWAKITGSTAATATQQAVYANYLTGEITIGSAATGGTATASMGSTNTGSLGSTNTATLGATFTATGTGTSLVVTSVTGLISIGDEISGTGVPADTTIVAQVSGTTGGAGTYTTSGATTASSATVTAFGSVVVVSATTGLISIGDTLNGGAGYPAGATILTQVSGTPGGAGTYTLSAPGTAYAASGSGVTTFGDVIKTTVTTGLISVGDTVSGGAGFPTGATITEQISGTAGGAGVYRISAAGSAYTASATGVKTYGNVLNVTAILSGTLGVGQPITGSGIPANAVISSQTTGSSGGVGVYTLSARASDYAAATTVTTTGGVLTNFKTASLAGVGELVKISTWN